MSILRASAVRGAFCGACVLLVACGNGTDYLKLKKRDAAVGDGGMDGGVGEHRDGSVNGGGGGGGAHGGKDAGGNSHADGGMPPGATMDAAALDLDAALDLPVGSWILQDGAILLPDGAIIDVDAAVMRYSPEIDVSKCEVGTEDIWSTEVDIADEAGFDLVPGHVGFGLAFRAIGSTTCNRKLDVMSIPATDGFGKPHAILDDCKAITDVTLLGEDDGWRAAWVDNYTGSAELHTVKLDKDMNVPKGGKRVTLTDNMSLFERWPVLREVAEQPMVAWITENVDTGKRRISTLRIDSGAPAVDVVKESAGQQPVGLAFSEVGQGTAAVGWVGPTDMPGVWLQKLDGNGTAVDKPIQLSSRVNVSSSIDIAHRMDGAGVIYSIAIDDVTQIRFRRLDESGNPMSERSIIGPPQLAVGASIATLGGGYAVAYRAQPDGAITAPEVRLTFITKDGSPMRDPNGRLLSFHIGDATNSDGRTYVSVSVEGEIMVAWLDSGDETSGKNVLKVVRRRLDCQ
jgi:hypothetical protein